MVEVDVSVLRTILSQEVPVIVARNFVLANGMRKRDQFVRE